MRKHVYKWKLIKIYSTEATYTIALNLQLKKKKNQTHDERENVIVKMQ